MTGYTSRRATWTVKWESKSAGDVTMLLAGVNVEPTRLGAPSALVAQLLIEGRRFDHAASTKASSLGSDVDDGISSKWLSKYITRPFGTHTTLRPTEYSCAPVASTCPRSTYRTYVVKWLQNSSCVIVDIVLLINFSHED